MELAAIVETLLHQNPDSGQHVLRNGLENELKNGPYIGLYSGPSTGPSCSTIARSPVLRLLLVDDVVATAEDLVPIPPVLATGGAGDIRAKGLEPFGRCQCIRIQKRPTKISQELYILELEHGLASRRRRIQRSDPN